MTAPVRVPTLAALQRKAGGLYREASKIDAELKAQGSLMTSFAIVRQRRVMAALRPAVEYALLRNRRPSDAAAVRYIKGLKLSMAALRDLGGQMGERVLSRNGTPAAYSILAKDHVEEWTASMAATACVVIAATAKPRDRTDAFIRLRFVLDYAWRLPDLYRDDTLQRIGADMRAIMWADWKTLPYRSIREDRRRFMAERNASKRAGRSFHS
jgi:hypothetical protein